MKTALLATRTATGRANYEKVRAVLASLGTCHLLHGGEGAAREHAQAWARETGNPETGYRANWAEHGRAAGPMRSRELIRAADTVVALWDGCSKGTENELREARRQKKRVLLLLAG